MEEKNYLEVGGKDFYLNFENLTKHVRLEPTKYTDEDGTEHENDAHIDVTRYEMIREMMGAILQTVEIVDDKMGVIGLNSMSIPFKISYNTLIHYDILKEVEEYE